MKRAASPSIVFFGDGATRPPRASPATSSSRWRRAREGVPSRGFRSEEVELRRKDGTAGPVRLSARPVSGQDGAPAGVLAVPHDLREEPHGRRELLEALAAVRGSP